MTILGIVHFDVTIEPRMDSPFQINQKVLSITSIS